MPKPKTKGKVVKIKGYAVLWDEGKGHIPIAIVYGTRALMMENIPKNIVTKVAPITITFSVPIKGKGKK